MKIYISLPINGYDLQERKQYAESVKKRLQQIYPDGEIITPFDVCTDPSLPYEELIGKDIAALLIVEQIILYILLPFAWILFGKRSNELYKISFIIWFANNKVLPFFEKWL